MKPTACPDYGQVIPTCKSKDVSFTFTHSINCLKFYYKSFWRQTAIWYLKLAKWGDGGLHCKRNIHTFDCKGKTRKSSFCIFEAVSASGV